MLMKQRKGGGGAEQERGRRCSTGKGRGGAVQEKGEECRQAQEMQRVKCQED